MRSASSAGISASFISDVAPSLMGSNVWVGGGHVMRCGQTAAARCQRARRSRSPLTSRRSTRQAGSRRTGTGRRASHGRSRRCPVRGPVLQRVVSSSTTMHPGVVAVGRVELDGLTRAPERPRSRSDAAPRPRAARRCHRPRPRGRSRAGASRGRSRRPSGGRRSRGPRVGPATRPATGCRTASVNCFVGGVVSERLHELLDAVVEPGQEVAVRVLRRSGLREPGGHRALTRRSFALRQADHVLEPAMHPAGVAQQVGDVPVGAGGYAGAERVDGEGRRCGRPRPAGRAADRTARSARGVPGRSSRTDMVGAPLAERHRRPLAPTHHGRRRLSTGCQRLAAGASLRLASRRWSWPCWDRSRSPAAPASSSRDPMVRRLAAALAVNPGGGVRSTLLIDALLGRRGTAERTQDAARLRPPPAAHARPGGRADDAGRVPARHRSGPGRRRARSSESWRRRKRSGPTAERERAGARLADTHWGDGEGVPYADLGDWPGVAAPRSVPPGGALPARRGAAGRAAASSRAERRSAAATSRRSWPARRCASGVGSCLIEAIRRPGGPAEALGAYERARLGADRRARRGTRSFRCRPCTTSSWPRPRRPPEPVLTPPLLDAADATHLLRRDASPTSRAARDPRARAAGHAGRRRRKRQDTPRDRGRAPLATTPRANRSGSRTSRRWRTRRRLVGARSGRPPASAPFRRGADERDRRALLAERAGPAASSTTPSTCSDAVAELVDDMLDAAPERADHRHHPGTAGDRGGAPLAGRAAQRRSFRRRRGAVRGSGAGRTDLGSPTARRNSPTCSSLCDDLDRLPLAVELAAAHVDVLCRRRELRRQLAAQGDLPPLPAGGGAPSDEGPVGRAGRRSTRRCAGAPTPSADDVRAAFQRLSVLPDSFGSGCGRGRVPTRGAARCCRSSKHSSTSRCVETTRDAGGDAVPHAGDRSPPCRSRFGGWRGEPGCRRRDRLLGLGGSAGPGATTA